jgi:hypothetical protein
MQKGLRKINRLEMFFSTEKVVTPTPTAPVGAELKGHKRHYSNLGRNLR